MIKLYIYIIKIRKLKKLKSCFVEKDKLCWIKNTLKNNWNKVEHFTQLNLKTNKTGHQKIVITQNETQKLKKFSYFKYSYMNS